MKYLFLGLMLVNLYTACKRSCGEPASNSFYFRLLDKSNSSNLIFCTANVFDNNRILFFADNNGKLDTIFRYTNNDYGTTNISCDSLISVFANISYSKIYMKLNNTDIDTISLTYVSTGSSYCGYYDNVSTIKFNGEQIVADSLNIYNFYK